AKERHTTEETKARGWGDIWTWIAMDADTKLIPCWYVGTRDAGAAYHFMHDLAPRLAHRTQLTTDGYKPYLTAVADAFGTDIDYAMLVKIYGEGPKTEARYSPALCMVLAKRSSPACRCASISRPVLSSVKILRCGWATVDSRA